MDKRCSSNIVNKVIRTNTPYSPLPKAALSLLKTPPAALSLALILRPGFNGHKPSSFVEGEGRLETVVNKNNTMGASCSPVCEMAHMPLVPEPATWPKAPLHLPSLPCKPQDTMEPNRQRLEHMDAVSAKMESVSHDRQTKEGLYLMPEPPLAHSHYLLGLMPDTRLRWKLPDLKELGQHPIDIVRLKSDEASRVYSPGPETARTPLAAELMGFPWAPFFLLCEPRCTKGLRRHLFVISGRCGETEGSSSPESSTVCHSPPLGFKFDNRLPWKPPGAMEIERHAENVIMSRNNGMNSQYSPTSKMALMPFAPPVYPCFLYESWDMAPVRQHGDGTDIVSMCSSGVEGSRLLEPLLAHISGIKLDSKLPWKLLDTEKTEQHAVNVVKMKFMK